MGGVLQMSIWPKIALLGPSPPFCQAQLLGFTQLQSCLHLCHQFPLVFLFLLPMLLPGLLPPLPEAAKTCS